MLLAPLVGLLATMALTATERAAEIPPIRISRMREEANPTMATVDRTACQTGMIAQDGIQRELILTNKRTDAVVLVPIRAKQKEFPDGYDKNARFSVKMLILLCMSSSYPLDANASRGRAGIFFWISTEACWPGRTTGPSANSYLSPLACPVGDASPRPLNPYLERKTSSSQSGIEDEPYYLFPGSGPFSRASPRQKAERYSLLASLLELEGRTG